MFKVAGSKEYLDTVEEYSNTYLRYSDSSLGIRMLVQQNLWSSIQIPFRGIRIPFSSIWIPFRASGYLPCYQLGRMENLVFSLPLIYRNFLGMLFGSLYSFIS